MRREQTLWDDWLIPAGVFVTGVFLVSLIGADRIDLWVAELGRAVKAIL